MGRIANSVQTYEQWGELAQEWRNSYLSFTRSIAKDSSIAYKTVDQHHLDSLREILTSRGLILPRDTDTPDALVHDGSLWDEAQIKDLSLIWHRLNPWKDTCKGIRDLNKFTETCTLTNGNLTLIRNMAAHAKMEFTHIFSAEMFNSYKPNPAIYLGAAEKLGLKPEECGMVAAHLDDLKAAKGCGFKTIYVERPLEERKPELKEEGFVDLWISGNEDGFVTAAERLAK